MASMAFTPICSKSIFHPLHCLNSNASICNAVPGMHSACLLRHEACKSFRLAYTNQARERSWRDSLRPICAAGSGGLDLSMIDSRGSNKVKFENVKIAVESREGDKIQLRVDLDGEDTQKAFDVILTNLANSSPVRNGFRTNKGGKTSKIPKNFLMDILGKSYVMKFALQELVKSAVATYVQEENLTVKDNKVTTTQTEDELYQSFSPGNGFGFNVEFELTNDEELTNEQTETTEAAKEVVALPKKFGSRVRKL